MESLPKQPDPQHDSPILPTLDQVHAHFQRWRTTRECKGKIPLPLWDQVFLLIGRYRETDICNKLRISKPRLQSAILSRSSEGSQTSVDFIPFTLPQTSSPTEPKTKDFIEAEIFHTNGTKLRVTSLREHQFLTLLQAFMKAH